MLFNRVNGKCQLNLDFSGQIGTLERNSGGIAKAGRQNVKRKIEDYSK